MFLHNIFDICEFFFIKSQKRHGVSHTCLSVQYTPPGRFVFLVTVHRYKGVKVTSSDSSNMTSFAQYMHAREHFITLCVREHILLLMHLWSTNIYHILYTVLFFLGKP